MTKRESLKISTLGGLSIQRAGEPVADLVTRKAEALLVYLACMGTLQTREALAELLWDERTQDRAMGNLRVVLTSLLKSLGEYVEITRDAVGIKAGADIWFGVIGCGAFVRDNQVAGAVVVTPYDAASCWPVP